MLSSLEEEERGEEETGEEAEEESRIRGSYFPQGHLPQVLKRHQANPMLFHNSLQGQFLFRYCFSALIFRTDRSTHFKNQHHPVCNKCFLFLQHKRSHLIIFSFLVIQLSFPERIKEHLFQRGEKKVQDYQTGSRVNGYLAA